MEGKQFDTFLNLELMSLSKSFSVTIGNWVFNFKSYTHARTHTHRDRNTGSGNKLGRQNFSYYHFIPKKLMIR